MQINLQHLGGDDEDIKKLVFRNDDFDIDYELQQQQKKSNKT